MNNITIIKMTIAIIVVIVIIDISDIFVITNDNR